MGPDAAGRASSTSAVAASVAPRPISGAANLPAALVPAPRPLGAARNPRTGGDLQDRGEKRRGRAGVGFLCSGGDPFGPSEGRNASINFSQTKHRNFLLESKGEGDSKTEP